MIKIDRERYEPEMHEWALKAIDRVRPCVYLGPRQLDGQRFKDTAHVFDILESMAEQRKFELYPFVCIERALKEAASADYWYSKEKDYGSDAQDRAAEEDRIIGEDYV
jgi:hypothetical protein